MKRILFTLFLLGLLALLTVQGDGWSLTPKAALAQESTTAQLPEPTLYMPSNVQRAFDVAVVPFLFRSHVEQCQ